MAIAIVLTAVMAFQGGTRLASMDQERGPAFGRHEAARPQEPVTAPRPPAGEFLLLEQGYSRALQAFRMRGPAAQAGHDRAPRSGGPSTAEFGRHFLALAQRHPQSDAARSALLWILRNCRRDAALVAQSVEELERNHVRGRGLENVLISLAQLPGVDAVPFLQAVKERNPHRTQRGAASFYLAAHLARRQSSPSGAERKDEVLALYRLVEREYADVPHGSSTLGRLAAARSFDLRRLRPGGSAGPSVQMFQPGFQVDELPIQLPNVNNVRYREDGKLVVLGYNGVISVLSDTDGDGLEDRADTFWKGESLRAPIGIALTPRGHPCGSGIVVASKGQVSLIVDADGDDQADEERIVATGWEELSYIVDALGVALDEDGCVYFGLGCADYKNPYLLDPQTGTSRYRLESERGTIQRVAPDFKRREVVCTGLRFPAALAFNRHGDLFCTDQEGETWLPGGNPRDELLHVVSGRHYGFPPRHARHLPAVTDEPSLYEYGPQHQAACGFCFNEAAEHRQHFGPAHWEGDAFVAGFGRGKLYRTKLARTTSGYVATNSIVAGLGLLAVDVAVSPDGRMIVACHSGSPSWGSGPDGPGKLFKISYTNSDAPQPVAIWAAGPLETRIAFDRPIDAALPEDFAQRVQIEYGDYVRAGDRFEVVKPAFREIDDQQNAPRARLRVVDAEMSDDRRTLRLRTLAHPARTWYAVQLPALDRRQAELQSSIELDYTVAGVEARWEPADSSSGAAEWSGWLPCLDLQSAADLLAGTAEQRQLLRRLRLPGRLTLRSLFDAPVDAVTIHVAADGPVEATLARAAMAGGPQRLTLKATSGGDLIPIVVSLTTGYAASRPATLAVSYQSQSDPFERSIPPQRLFLPWAPPPLPEFTNPPGPPLELAGGNWSRGRAVFLEEGRCAQCHNVRGEGNAIGLDLSDLIHRDARSVLRDILEPAATIHPEFVSYVVALRSGRTLAGFLRPAGQDQVRLMDLNRPDTIVSTIEIESLSASRTSTMPAGLDQLVGPERMRDLLTFLLEPPPVSPDGCGGP